MHPQPAVVMFGLAFLSAGCSFVFTSGPPPVEQRPPPPQPVDCSTSVAPPAIDTVVAGLEAVRTAIALGAKNSDYSGAPIDRTTDITVGVALFGVFALSATYGYFTTARCGQLNDQRAELPWQSAPSPSLSPVPPLPPVQPAPPPPTTAQPSVPAPAPVPSAPPIVPDAGVPDLQRDAPF
jgi:hypothetical protein